MKMSLVRKTNFYIKTNAISQLVFLFIILGVIVSNNCLSNEIPSVYKNIRYESDKLIYENPTSGKIYYQKFVGTPFAYSNIANPAIGTATGLKFNFNYPELEGKIYYGLYQKNNRKIKYPIYLNKSANINGGIAEINILNDLAGKRDIANWKEEAFGKLGYRVVNKKGEILYDGKLDFSGNGPFEVKPYISEGPFVNMVTDSSAIISLKTNVPQTIEIIVNSQKYISENSINHQFELVNLNPGTVYTYQIINQNYSESYQLKTNPKKGQRNPFTFAFSSDSRTGYGGGERDLNGVNSYIMKKSAAFAASKNAAFFQFTGDMITGYLQSYDETLLEYANWKRTIEPYASFMPFYVGMGNHENVTITFDDGSNYGININAFPFKSKSSESAFIESFVNFENGPISEDNSKYDINPDKVDFPPYKEQVYHYNYDNIGVIVLNSNYLYSSSYDAITNIGGNLHAYIMDNQLDWLDKTIKLYNEDSNIDHIFVTIHTPAFPNGGHSYDAMWYSGNNAPRPHLFGKPVDKGIIERRDEFLDIICNKTDKVVALMTGDEHNYSRMKISSDMQMYPENWDKPKLKIKNPIWQIVNGAAGAPYYGQEKMPWSNFVETFTAEHIICMINVDGKKVNLEVYNPETLELYENINLK